MTRRTGRTFFSWMIVCAGTVAVAAAVGMAAFHFLRPLVQVTHPVEGPVVQAFYSTGTVQPVREFPIKANHAGIITKMLVDKGDTVKAGQPLVVVEEKELKFALDKAVAELNEKLARADETNSPVLKEYDSRIAASNDMLGIAKRDLSRVAGLIERDAATQFDADRAQDRVTQMNSQVETLKSEKATKQLELLKEVEVAKSAVSVAQWNLDQQTILSPTDGVVLDRPESIGTRLAVNDHIMQVADVRPENLVMRAQVDEEDKNKVRLDQTVRMTLYSFPDEVFEGRVTRIYDKADSERRTFEIDVMLRVPNPNFAAGMTGELAFIMAAKDRATVIPSQAVQQGTVYLVRNGVIATAEAKIGLRSVERVEVLSGIASGDEVIISPVLELKPGQRVRTEAIDPLVAANLNKKTTEKSNFKGFQ